jgi:hypothetical protein
MCLSEINRSAVFHILERPLESRPQFVIQNWKERLVDDAEARGHLRKETPMGGVGIPELVRLIQVAFEANR